MMNTSSSSVNSNNGYNYNYNTSNSEEDSHWEECSMYLTIDKYLVIIPGAQDSLAKPAATIFLPPSKAIFSKEKMVVRVEASEKRFFFWNRKKTFDFKLLHEFDA